MDTTTSNLNFEGEKAQKKLSEEELRLMVESGYSSKATQLHVDNVNVGKLDNASVVTTFLDPCGDLIKLYLKINEKTVNEDAKFHYLGCPSSAPSASAMTTLLKGKTVEQAKMMVRNDILTELSGLPKYKLDCTTLSIKTLRKALAKYEKLRGRL